jgi:PDZ domain
LSSLAFARKQPAEQAIVSWYEGPVRDWYGGSCPIHPDGHRHFPIAIHGCWRNLIVLKAGDKYLTMEDHCAIPWKFKQGETVEFQRDVKYPRKIYLNRHVFALTRESDTPDEVERSTPALRDNPAPSNSQLKASSAGTLGLVGFDWNEGGVRGVQISDISEDGSAPLAGLHKGDVIVELNGEKIGSTQDLSRLLEEIEPGSKISIAYLLNTNLGWMPKETSAIVAKRD